MLGISALLIRAVDEHDTEADTPRRSSFMIVPDASIASASQGMLATSLNPQTRHFNLAEHDIMKWPRHGPLSPQRLP